MFKPKKHYVSKSISIINKIEMFGSLRIGLGAGLTPLLLDTLEQMDSECQIHFTADMFDM